MFEIIKKHKKKHTSNHTKCVPLSNQKSKSTLINLHPNQYSQELHYYPIAVKLKNSFVSCNTLNDLCNNVWISNKTHVFNMITGKNKSKILTKDISCKNKFSFDKKKCNSNRSYNNNKYRCECKKRYACEKDYIWNNM